MRIIACSDLHNGTTANYEKYHALLRIVEKECPHYFLKVGDGIELVWETMEHNLTWPPSRDVIEHERTIARTVCPVIELSGNHNLDMVQYAKLLYPIKVGEEFCIFDGITYIHGHQFDPTVRYWWEPLQTAFRKIVPCLGRRLFGTPFTLKKEGRDISYSKLVSIVERNFQLWLNGRSGVFGHTHSEFVKQRKGQTIANLGDFYDSCSFLRINDGVVHLDWI